LPKPEMQEVHLSKTYHRYYVYQGFVQEMPIITKLQSGINHNILYHTCCLIKDIIVCKYQLEAHRSL